jgi:cyclic 2,3-diphosphoglycerate synthetase
MVCGGEAEQKELQDAIINVVEKSIADSKAEGE